MFKKYDIVTIAASLILMAALVIGTIFAADQVVAGLAAAKNWVIYKLGWFFILVVAGIMFYVLWLAFSKYGSIRMGRCKPQYGWFGYAAMVFCAAMGSCMIFWPSVEWAEYICGGAYPFDWGIETMANNALSYSFFHWGIPAWAVYAAGIVPIGYRYFVMNKPGLTIQGACEGLFGEKRVQGPLGTVINIIFIVGILGGLTITYGTGIPMLANFLHVVLGTPESFLMNFILILLLTALFTWSALSGIHKGILNLSRLCIIFCAVMLGMILILGNTGYIINVTTHSVGLQFQNFFSMLFNVGPGRTAYGTNFAMDWTVFYWAWWLGLAPVMWIFIAKCSKGRTIRNIILTVIVSGFLADIVFFGIISGNGLSLYTNFDWSALGSGTTPLDAFYNSWNEFAFISDTLTATLPASKVILAVWFIGTFLLLVTTMDSAAYTMSAATQHNVGVNADPVKKLRLFWACLLSISPLCILYAQAGTSSCTAVVILTSIPVMILVLVAIIGSTKWILRDFGKMSRAEIEAFFETDEEREARLAAENGVKERYVFLKKSQD